MKQGLRQAEWFIVIAILGAITSSAIYSMIASRNTYPLQLEEGFFASDNEKISIEILGDVQKPGKYRVIKGLTLKELVKRAKPKKFANLKKGVFLEKVTSDTKVRIERLENVIVFLKGEVKEECQLELPIRTRLSDLKKRGLFLPSADLSKLKSKRFLVDGESVYIPKKNSN